MDKLVKRENPASWASYCDSCESQIPSYEPIYDNGRYTYCSRECARKHQGR